MLKSQYKVKQRYTKKEENMAQPKEQNKSPETNLKEMEVYELPDKEFYI